MSVHDIVKNNPVVAIPLTAILTFAMTVAMHWGSDRVHIEQTETASRIQIEALQKRIDTLATKEQVLDLFEGLATRIDDLRQDLRAPVSRPSSARRNIARTSPIEAVSLQIAAPPAEDAEAPIKTTGKMRKTLKWVPVHGAHLLHKVFGPQKLEDAPGGSDPQDRE